jgi:hypothetical protein
MKLFKRKNKVHTINVDLKTLARRMLYDGQIVNPEATAVAMGLPPISEEVSAMERRKSDERLTVIEGLSPMLIDQASLIAEAVAITHMKAMPDDHNIENIDTTYELVGVAYQQVAVATTFSVLSTLFDLGIVEWGSRE